MTRAGRITSLLTVSLAVACNGSPNEPSPSPTPAAATITITASGVSPKSVQISLGQRVRFVNNSTVEHDMGSDPHPDHTDCPPLNVVGILKPGESRETGNFVIVRTCGFHDHLDPNNVGLQGSVVTR